MPSKITTDLAVDDPVVLDADYKLSAVERRYIDDQIRGLQQHLVSGMLLGLQGTWVRLAASSAAVVIGDWLCGSASSSAADAATKVTSSAIADAGIALGMVLVATAPGSMVFVATGGLVKRSLSGLAAGNAGLVRVNLTSGRSERVASFSGGDYPVGAVDSAGNMTIRTLFAA